MFEREEILLSSTVVKIAVYLISCVNGAALLKLTRVRAPASVDRWTFSLQQTQTTVAQQYTTWLHREK